MPSVRRISELAIAFLLGNLFAVYTSIFTPSNREAIAAAPLDHDSSSFAASRNMRSVSPVSSRDTIPNNNEFPVQIFPLLHEMGIGKDNMEIPKTLFRDASKNRTLVVDIGLDEGLEFFTAIEHGFEVVGFEPNPKTFKTLAEKCSKISSCLVTDPEKLDLPLKRQPGISYLINAGAGNARSNLEMNVFGPFGTFVKQDALDVEKATVPVYRLDSIIDEDVFLLKIDTQGFDHYVLEGAEGIFERNTVRQVIAEVEPYYMSQLGLNILQTLRMLHGYGMMCFSDSTYNADCHFSGDSAEGYNAKLFTDVQLSPDLSPVAKCWDDLICVNFKKEYRGPIPALLP